MVDVAASIAHAASTAFPPRVKVMPPAVAASGLPVMATQCFPCRTGLIVFCAMARSAVNSAARQNEIAAMHMRPALIKSR